MKDRNTLIFTHIRKTGGKAVRKLLLYPNFSDSEIYEAHGLKKMLLDQPKNKLILGHSLFFGLHKLLIHVNNPIYILILRHPIERAISFYYFFRQLTPKHRYFSSSHSLSLGEFWKVQTELQNYQSRMIAGLLSERLLNFNINGNILGNYVFEKSKENLMRENVFFGLTEELPLSIKIIANKFNLKKQTMKKVNANPNRPKIEEIREKDLYLIKKYNSVDIKLYDFARNEFYNK